MISWKWGPALAAGCTVNRYNSLFTFEAIVLALWTLCARLSSSPPSRRPWRRFTWPISLLRYNTYTYNHSSLQSYLFFRLDFLPESSMWLTVSAKRLEQPLQLIRMSTRSPSPVRLSWVNFCLEVLNHISFTLLVCIDQVGKLIMEEAAKSNLKRVSLELGGKSPIVVFPDVDCTYFFFS